MENLPQNSGAARAALRGYYLFKVLPLIICGVSIYLGYRLFILGVSGQASLSIDSKSIKGQLINAAPGLFFAVGGIVGIIVTVAKGLSISFSDEGGNQTTAALKADVPASKPNVGGGGGGGEGGGWPFRRNVILQAPRKHE